MKGTIKGNKNKIIKRQNESEWIELISNRVLDKILPKNIVLNILVSLLLFPILLAVNLAGYTAEMLFNFNKKLPKEFRLSFK